MRTLTINPIWSRRLTSDLFKEMDNFFDEPAAALKSDIAENDHHYLISVDVPGIKKEDLKIEVKENRLTLRGERKGPTYSDLEVRGHLAERSYGFFQRTFTLPAAADLDKVEATYEDGVLELHVPKLETAKPRQIPIKSGEGIMSKLLGSTKMKEIGNK